METAIIAVGATLCGWAIRRKAHDIRNIRRANAAKQSQRRQAAHERALDRRRDNVSWAGVLQVCAK